MCSFVIGECPAIDLITNLCQIIDPRFKIQHSRQLYYLIDEKLMTRFAIKMELYYTLNYSYHKIDPVIDLCQIIDPAISVCPNSVQGTGLIMTIIIIVVCV